MSADSWRECPNCKIITAKRQDSAIQKAAEAYGKVPMEEYQKLRDRVNESIELEDTYAEYKELFLGKDGKFYINYYGECTTCGFSYTYKLEQQVELPGKAVHKKS